jgi:hypothetical protein
LDIIKNKKFKNILIINLISDYVLSKK